MKLAITVVKEIGKYIITGFGPTGHEEFRFTCKPMPREMLYAETVKRASAAGHTVTYFGVEKA